MNHFKPFLSTASQILAEKNLSTDATVMLFTALFIKFLCPSQLISGDKVFVNIQEGFTMIMVSDSVTKIFSTSLMLHTPFPFHSFVVIS